MVMTTPDHSQTHRFPSLGVVIRVDRPHDGVPRVNVSVPDELLNGKFDAARWPSTAEAQLSDQERSKRRHHICNQLHIVSMSLDLLQNSSIDGDRDDIEQTLEIAITSMNELELLATG